MACFRSVLIVAALCIFVGCASGPSERGPGPSADRPTYSIGEKWIRSDGEYELIRIEDGRYVFAAEGGREVELTQDLAISRVRRGQHYMAFDPPPRLTWPLQVGSSGYDLVTWTVSWNLSAIMAVTYHWEVQAFERVKTEAGVFNAFRIVHTLTFAEARHRRAAGAERSFVTWYAPEVRQFVKARIGSRGPRIIAFDLVAVEQPDTVPLEIGLREPRDQAHLQDAATLVTGKLQGGKGFRRVIAVLNGVEAARQEHAPVPDMVQLLEIPLQLKNGKNILLVTVSDFTGAVRSDSRTLFLEPPPDKTTQPPAPTPALTIVISSPQDRGRVAQESMTLTGNVSAVKGVKTVLVTVNGAEVSRLTEQGAGEVPLNVPLRLHEGENSIVVTVTEPDGRISQEVRLVRYVKPVPLTVTIRYPEDRLRVTNENGVIAAAIASSEGIARVTVTLNGTEVHQQNQRNRPQSLVVNAPLTLQDGANVITLSATDANGKLREETRTVFFDNPGADDAVVESPEPRKREAWAVIIGAGRYDSREIPRLRYAVPDAELLRQVLVGSGGFKPEHVLLLTDTVDRKPTLRNMKWALGTFLARSAQKGDTVFIFFAGHGAPEVDREGVERDGVAKYLVPVDAEPDDLYATAFPMDELQTIFARIEAERVLVFLDACYSGAAGGRTFAVKQMVVDESFLDRLARAKGRAILAASQPTEVALETAELGHGLFSFYLGEGLKGAADINKDGMITLQELYDYVQQQVTAKAQLLGGKQHPVLKGELDPTSPLVKLPM